MLLREDDNRPTYRIRCMVFYDLQEYDPSRLAGGKPNGAGCHGARDEQINKVHPVISKQWSVRLASTVSLL